MQSVLRPAKIFAICGAALALTMSSAGAGPNIPSHCMVHFNSAKDLQKTFGDKTKAVGKVIITSTNPEDTITVNVTNYSIDGASQLQVQWYSVNSWVYYKTTQNKLSVAEKAKADKLLKDMSELISIMNKYAAAKKSLNECVASANM